MGAARFDIGLEVLARIVLLTFAGVALGLASAFSFRGLFQRWFEEAVVLGFKPVWKAVTFVVPAMALAGLYPAVVSANLPPVQAVREEPVWKRSDHAGRLDVRNVLAAALPQSNEVLSVTVVPCSPSFASMRKFQLSSGRFFLHKDDTTPVCVIGSKLASTLFG